MAIPLFMKRVNLVTQKRCVGKAPLIVGLILNKFDDVCIVTNVYVLIAIRYANCCQWSLVSNAPFVQYGNEGDHPTRNMCSF